ncbi:MAG: nucleotide exchange factor GrpE [Syntrophobacterales bacterium]|nr:nucleotide exchange factor GrpE [Syntrophobacterales bacterium]
MIKYEKSDHPENSIETKELKDGEEEQQITEGPNGQIPEEGPSREELLEFLKQKDEEIAKLNDRMLRMMADVDNMRKRLEREREDIICYGNEQLLKELLPVIDNLERALQHGGDQCDPKVIREGIELTLKNFFSVLEKFGCKPFDSLGMPFDPRYHEAVMQRESTEYPENTVIEEFQKGYTFRDRLLRPAMVVVAKGSARH